MFILLNAVCFAEKQKIPILLSAFTLSGLEPTIYNIPGGEHANHYDTDEVEWIKYYTLNDNTIYIQQIHGDMFIAFLNNFKYMSFLIWQGHIRYDMAPSPWT